MTNQSLGEQGQVVSVNLRDPGMAAVEQETSQTPTSSSPTKESGASRGRNSFFSAEKAFSPDKKSSDPLQAILQSERVSSQEKALPSEIVDVSKAALERALVLYQKATDSSVKQVLETYLAPLLPILPKNKDGTVNIDILNDPNNISSIVEKFISETKEHGIFLGLAFAQREYAVLANAYTITQKAIEPASFPDSSKVMYSFEGGVGFEIDTSTGAITFEYGEPTKMTYEQYVEKAKKEWEEARKSRFARWFTHRGKEPKLMTKEEFEEMQHGKKGKYTFEFSRNQQSSLNDFDKFYLQQIGLLTQFQTGGEILSDPTSDIETIKFLGRRVMEMGVVAQEYFKATGFPENQRIEKIQKIISGGESLFTQQQVENVKKLIEEEREKAQKEDKKRIEGTSDLGMVKSSRSFLLAEKKRLTEEIEKRKQEEEKRKEKGEQEELTEKKLSEKLVGVTASEEEVKGIKTKIIGYEESIAEKESELVAIRENLQSYLEEQKNLYAALERILVIEKSLSEGEAGRLINPKGEEISVPKASNEQQITVQFIRGRIQKLQSNIDRAREDIQTISSQLSSDKKELRRLTRIKDQKVTFNGQTKTVEEWLGLLEEQKGISETEQGGLKSLEELQKELDEIDILLEITDPERQGEIAQRQAELDRFATGYLNEKKLNEFMINNPWLAEEIGLDDDVLKDQKLRESAIKSLQLVYVLFGEEAILGGADREERIKKITHFLLSSGKPLLRDINLSELRMKIDEIRLAKVKNLRSQQE
jgi:hypothetical protein